MRRQTQTGGREPTLGVIPGAYALSVGKPDKPIPETWSWTRLTDVARLESGHTPSRRRPEYWGGEIPWIGIRDATSNYGRTIYDTQQHTNQLGVDNSSARVLPEGTVCLSRTASVGYVIVMGRPMATSQDFVNWVCGDGINNQFLKYVLIAERESLNMFSMGTTHQTIYYPEVKAFHVALPPRDEQDAIVGLLGALDDKIELNRRTNETLEAMARAVFKDWFVDFGPTRAKAEGRAHYLAPELWGLFPATLDDEDKPFGWKSKPLDEIAEFLNGLALQKYPASGHEDSLPVIRIAELRAGVTSKTPRASREVPERYVVQDDDFLFSWSGSLVARFWTDGEGALNQHLFKVSSDHYPAWFFSHWIWHHLEEFQAIAASKATTMGHIQRRHLRDAVTTCPPDSVLAVLGQTIGPLVDLTVENALETRTLAQTRDLLLPKLMSGEIRLAEAKKGLEAVA